MTTQTLIDIQAYQRMLTQCLADMARLGYMGAQPLTYALADLVDLEAAVKANTAPMARVMTVLTQVGGTYHDTLRKLYPNAYAYEREVLS